MQKRANKALKLLQVILFEVAILVTTLSANPVGESAVNDGHCCKAKAEAVWVLQIRPRVTGLFSLVSRVCHRGFTKMLNKNLSPYQRVYSPHTLHYAWNQIYANGLRSTSKITRSEIQKFKKKERSNIDRIARKMRNKRIDFKSNIGILAGEKKRPIVIAPVETRIVQRAILDVLQSEKNIQRFLLSRGSYGAIKGFEDQEKGVPAAIKDLAEIINNGATTYYKSDIKSFFTKINRPKVIETIAQDISDQDFLKILNMATNLEITNILKLPEKFRKFFDYSTEGTPQGCCLSPLIGNILLHEFDQEMNKNDVFCLRYLDDFIILGNGWKAVQNAFNKALQILSSLGLSAYQIGDASKKASSGHTHNPFQFLGVEFHGNNIRPSKESRKKLIDSIKNLLNDFAKQNFSSEKIKKQNEHSWVNTLHNINNKLKGWGNHYYFCNEASIWGSIDTEINELLKKGWNTYYSKINKENANTYRKILGVHLISESKHDPIILKSPSTSKISKKNTSSELIFID